MDGETGYLVPFDQDPVTSFPRDPEKFARDLGGETEVICWPIRRSASGLEKRDGKRAEEKFSWTSIADQTIALYQSLIEARK